jgi:hypothetical protein
MEHRVKKPVNYKVLNTKGKVDDVFDISTEMTPKACCAEFLH